jgi:hypothetical protein
MSLAMLDAIMCREWEYRYYLYDRHWAPGEEMTKMSDGEGDEWFCVFSNVGAFIKGFDHESTMSPWGRKEGSVVPGVLDCPPEFERFATEPAFSRDDTTFCIWRKHTDPCWQIGPVAFDLTHDDDPDGSIWMLKLLSGAPEDYKEWAEGYYGRNVEIDCVRHVYDHRSLASELVVSLNPDATLAVLREDIEQIGYPLA